MGNITFELEFHYFKINHILFFYLGSFVPKNDTHLSPSHLTFIGSFLAFKLFASL